MAIAATMSHDNINNKNEAADDEHDLEQDTVMPGFRFHPTEEELIEFYLRRKVEGKRFNVELITFLDLYRYDPWELPALAAIGENEWFFYVPRDRKYRNGDRPNRVTTSGYWKATGADRLIRGENCRSIGLKKTLVFYSGKAPKGIRTSWIMNEYRLPHHETERYQKAETSLCRVYKRAGIEDHPSVPRCNLLRASSAKGTHSQSDRKKHQDEAMNKLQAFGGAQSQKMKETEGISNSTDNTKTLVFPNHNLYPSMTPINTTLGLPVAMDEEGMLLQQSKQAFSLIASCSDLFVGPTSLSTNGVDDLHRLLTYQQHQASASLNQPQEFHNNHYQQSSQLSPLPQQSEAMALSTLSNSISPAFWDWNPMAEPRKDFNASFK